MKFDEPIKEQGGVFVQLKGGDSVVGIVTGDEVICYKKWVDGKSIECAPDDDGARFRFSVNMLVEEGGKWKAKILEQGVGIYEDLRTLSEAGYDLERTKIRISREGSGFNDTKYTVLPAPNGTLSDGQLEELSGIELNALK